MVLHEIKVLNRLQLTPVDEKFWKSTAISRCVFMTDEGAYVSTVFPGFITDLRSGCDLINAAIPKWGNDAYSWSIVSHDIAFHGWLSFGLANELYLRQGLRVSGQVGSFRAGLAASTVGAFGRSHYSQFDDELPPPYENNRPLCRIDLVPKI